MSETADYDPGPWKGRSFTSARAKYDRHVGRSYGDAVKAKKTATSLVPTSIKTNSKAPLVIMCDVTGSMGDWPATIFSKLPYLELEGQEYLGEDMEISFAAIGDVFSDTYPLQVRKFSKGTDLEKQLEELVVEGNGGGQTRESYDMGALYYARSCKMPKAINPICIFIGDEGLYDFVDRQKAEEHAKISLPKRLETSKVFEELKRKFSVYLIRKPYNRYYTIGDKRSSDDRVIHAQWEELLGPERISILPAADRVVDVIFGILAKETNRVDYFKKELKDRQTKDQVKTVMKSLKTIHKISEPKSIKKLTSGQSKMHRKVKGKKTKSLL